MNKDLLTSHILDFELKQDLKKILGIYESAAFSHVTKNTKFLTPHQLKLTENILFSLDEIQYKAFSPNQDAERKVLYFYQDYVAFEEIDSVIAILKISYNPKHSQLSHRDYLGSILALGIERENIGDIVVGEEGQAYIMVLKPMDQFLLDNLDKVKNEKVKVEIVDNLPFLEAKFEEVIINVASIRIDSVIARLLGLSRDKAQSLVQSGRVYIDYAESKDKSVSLKEGTVISVRGFGKFRFEEIVTETKKNRFRVKFLKYLN